MGKRVFDGLRYAQTFNLARKGVPMGSAEVIMTEASINGIFQYAIFYLQTGLLQTGDCTANRQFVKTRNACAARAAIFAKWASGGVKAHFAKLQCKEGAGRFI